VIFLVGYKKIINIWRKIRELFLFKKQDNPINLYVFSDKILEDMNISEIKIYVIQSMGNNFTFEAQYNLQDSPAKEDFYNLNNNQKIQVIQNIEEKSEMLIEQIKLHIYEQLKNTQYKISKQKVHDSSIEIKNFYENKISKQISFTIKIY
jgi:hypothetical protein